MTQLSAGHTIDLNADIGEGMSDNDHQLLAIVSSVNIACGFHAGSPAIMLDCIERALQHDVAIGAHPGYQDREHFGRKEMQLETRELYAAIQYQVGALQALALARGGRVAHVKPHGALYNQAARDSVIADIVAAAVQDMGMNLTLVGLAGSESIHAAERIGLPVWQEVFADRTYRPDGSLTPRNEPGALIEDPKLAFEQTLKFIQRKPDKKDGASALTGFRADTVCLHGDSPHALLLAQSLREGLLLHEIAIAPPGWQFSAAPEESVFPLLA